MTPIYIINKAAVKKCHHSLIKDRQNSIPVDQSQLCNLVVAYYRDRHFTNEAVTQWTVPFWNMYRKKQKSMVAYSVAWFTAVFQYIRLQKITNSSQTSKQFYSETFPHCLSGILWRILCKEKHICAILYVSRQAWSLPESGLVLISDNLQLQFGVKWDTIGTTAAQNHVTVYCVLLPLMFIHCIC